MKKIMWLTITAVSVAALYNFVKKYMMQEAMDNEPRQPIIKHHLTTAFSKAKAHATIETSE
ncbi:MAG: hypothetical protein WAU24_14280 [Chitinophagaceae bacterium]